MMEEKHIKVLTTYRRCQMARLALAGWTFQYVQPAAREQGSYWVAHPPDPKLGPIARVELSQAVAVANFWETHHAE